MMGMLLIRTPYWISELNDGYGIDLKAILTIRVKWWVCYW